MKWWSKHNARIPARLATIWPEAASMLIVLALDPITSRLILVSNLSSETRYLCLWGLGQEADLVNLEIEILGFC